MMTLIFLSLFVQSCAGFAKIVKSCILVFSCFFTEESDVSFQIIQVKVVPQHEDKFAGACDVKKMCGVFATFRSLHIVFCVDIFSMEESGECLFGKCSLLNNSQ